MPPTESLLKELEELEKKATPKPWIREYSDGIIAFIETEGEECILIEEGFGFAKPNDFLLVSKARNSLPALLQMMQTYREALTRIEYRFSLNTKPGLEPSEMYWHSEVKVLHGITKEALSRCDEIAKGVGK